MSNNPSFMIEVDEPVFARVEADVAMAMILQNARFGKRLDPLASARTPKTESAVLGVGKVACALGVLLMLIVGLPDLFSGKGMEPGLAMMLLIFLALSVVFFLLPAILKAFVVWIDRLLTRRAKKCLARVRPHVPATVGYQVEPTGLKGCWHRGEEELSQWFHEFAEHPYGLIGRQGIALFKSRQHLNPSLVLFSTQPELVDQLRSHAVLLETLTQDLFPTGRGEEFWQSSDPS